MPVWWFHLHKSFNSNVITHRYHLSTYGPHPSSRHWPALFAHVNDGRCERWNFQMNQIECRLLFWICIESIKLRCLFASRECSTLDYPFNIQGNAGWLFIASTLCQFYAPSENIHVGSVCAEPVRLVFSFVDFVFHNFFFSSSAFWRTQTVPLLLLLLLSLLPLFFEPVAVSSLKMSKLQSEFTHYLVICIWLAFAVSLPSTPPSPPLYRVR